MADASDALSMHNEFSMLNLADLLAARERNHFELMRKPHVIGTAVGLYLIRKSDSWPRKNDGRRHAQRPPRTLDNSEVRDYSWPCILAFVDEWKSEHELPVNDRLPDSLYLDERRKVPVCVVWSPRQDAPSDVPIRPVAYPSDRIGGGFPVIADVQGREHVASIGCLVRDGHFVYALTNRHVTGPAGEVVYGRLGADRVRIGVSSSKQLSRLPFAKLYPDFAVKETFAHLDIGLIKVDDVNCWTADVYGIGTMGPIADLGIDNLSLRLIDCPVRAYGCGSGQMRGQIKALFYRYKSLGGFEYVADFLIGPRTARRDLGTHPGDSGTVWLLESQSQGLMPIAVQWGGQVFSNDGTRQQSSYALATCLSTVCNLLDVDVIRDWNVGVTEYWGEVGHFAIGALACTVGFTGMPGLKRLMSRNIPLVGFAVQDLKDPDRVIRSRAKFTFVPLADVADDVWRTTRASGKSTDDDGNNHFADMDQKAASGRFKGKTLLQLCADPANVDPAIWDEFYRGVPRTRPGALPFRVWQGYELMVAALKSGDVATFVNAAGCLAHYVGDACQPLHISRFHHGDPDGDQRPIAKKVHSVYETDMLSDLTRTPAIVNGIVAGLKRKRVAGSFTGGKGAALRVIRLMRETVAALPPKDIVDTYNAGKTPSDRLNRLWTAFGGKTIDRMTAGCICLADIWAAAWKEGNGAAIPAAQLVAQDPDVLSAQYRTAAFYPSMALSNMIALLKGAVENESAPADRSGPRRRTVRKRAAANAAAGTRQRVTRAPRRSTRRLRRGART
jgi:hypothetical protein